MENVYDIFSKKNMVYILPEDYAKAACTGKLLHSAAVVAYLYYPEALQFYLNYLDNVPDGIDVYVISSNPAAEEKISAHTEGKKYFHFLRKENRGRDVSAFFVTFREMISRYRYVCFVHDKKTKYDYLTDDTDDWIQCLWDNALKSKEYICNVLGLLEERSEIGLLVPPLRIGEYMDEWYTDGWHGDFEITRQLCGDFDLKCDIDEKKPVMTLGTVFWARTEIFTKILSKEWKYQDFPAEPMPSDGTISHGLERVLPYAAQDAGKLTGVVMCGSYAASLYIRVQSMMRRTYSQLKESFHIFHYDQLMNYAALKKRTQEVFEDHKKLYLYGAGKYGKRFLRMLDMWGYRPVGFLVSDGQKKSSSVEGYPIWELHEFDGANAVIAITTNYENHDEMRETLKKYGIQNYFIAC